MTFVASLGNAARTGAAVILAIGCGKSVATPETTDAAPLSAECAQVPPLALKPVYRIGFVPSHEATNRWADVNASDVTAEVKKQGDTLIYTPPVKGDAAEQMAAMSALVESKVDVIVLCPVDAAALAPAVVAARKACIPVLTEGRFLDPNAAVAGRDYVTGIGADPVVQGQRIADWLIGAKLGHAAIIELEGTAGSSSAIGRKKGFGERIATDPGLQIVASESGSFERTIGHDVAKQLLVKYPRSNVIYAHADAMALGALAAVRELGKIPGKDVLILSNGGLKEAIDDVVNGTIAAIEFSDPKFGALTHSTIRKYASGQAIPPRILVRAPVIDKTNVASMMAEGF
jgi:ribose transport system substrate-binding protein